MGSLSGLIPRRAEDLTEIDSGGTMKPSSAYHRARPGSSSPTLDSTDVGSRFDQEPSLTNHDRRPQRDAKGCQKPREEVLPGFGRRFCYSHRRSKPWAPDSRWRVGMVAAQGSNLAQMVAINSYLFSDGDGNEQHPRQKYGPTATVDGSRSCRAVAGQAVYHQEMGQEAEDRSGRGRPVHPLLRVFNRAIRCQAPSSEEGWRALWR